MPQDVPRFAPGIAFPPYTYVPRKTPHPASDPAGHSFGEPPPPPPTPLSDWRRSVEYRYGIDLFNHAYYWEAHEVWEGLWHAEDRGSPLAQVLQGLIKLAAAGVKTAAGSERGRRRHARRAAELFAQAAAVNPATRAALRRATGLSLEQLVEWAAAVSDEDNGSSPLRGDSPLRGSSPLRGGSPPERDRNREQAPESGAEPAEGEPRCVFAFRLLLGGSDEP